MTTFETALTWVGRSLQSVAERRARQHARARRVASNALQQLWNLTLVLCGLAGFTYAAWSVSHPLGYAVGGACFFVLRSIVVWGEKREG